MSNNMQLLGPDPVFSSGRGTYIGQILVEFFDGEPRTISWSGAGFSQLLPRPFTSALSGLEAQAPLALAIMEAGRKTLSDPAKAVESLPESVSGLPPITQNDRTMAVNGYQSFDGRVVLEGWLDNAGMLETYVATSVATTDRDKVVLKAFDAITRRLEGRRPARERDAPQ